ncbi:unnamed protein product [Rhizoctonia solani]|uniref:Chromo domain-containing protein n=1 Tax=Rhizoctonia solani TaxID=456999 RepID=A0A8H3AZN5_9AGAM|nr:unnamed protein product [Rhizoctonia solani]
MPRPEPGEPSSESEDEYEVEFVYGARWTQDGWEYEVHWYGYDTQYDTWEPEANLTEYGSADLVNRFWKEFPKKRVSPIHRSITQVEIFTSVKNSRPTVGTKYTASADWLVAERKRFLSRRQKDQPVKGRETPPRKSVRQPVALQGDSESESEGSNTDDEDVLRSSSDRDDEDVLQSSSSSEDAPLSARRPLAAGSNIGTSTIARVQTQADRRRKPFQSVKSNARTQLKSSTALRDPTGLSKISSAPKGHTNTIAQVGTALQTNATPGVRKVTTISRDPVPLSRRGRQSLNRPSMEAGNISGSFVGIGTKGKQAERAGEVIALGRKSPPPKNKTVGPSNMYAGMSMRKITQQSTNTAHNVAPTEATENEHIAISPTEVSPTEPGPPPVSTVVDNFISDIAAGIGDSNSRAGSPTDSLFDGPYEPGEVETQAPGDFSHMEVDLPEFDDPPPPPPVMIQQRPTVSTGSNVTRGSIDGPASARGPLSSDYSFSVSPIATNIPLPPGQPLTVPQATRVWTGELYITTLETDPDNGDITKDVASRACEVVITDTVIPNEQTAKNFKGILNKYIKDKMTIPGVMDVHLSFATIASGALSVYQAAWMTCTDPQGSSEWQLWDGLIHKMEVYLWVSEIRIMASNNNEFSQRLLLIPTTLLRKYRNIPAPRGICEHFRDEIYTQIPSFVVLMLKKEVGSVSDNEEPLAMQVSQLPKYWQQIPPEMKPSFAGVNCLVFPSREFDYDYEVRLMRHQLRQCGAHVIEGSDPKDTAGAIFIHRRYMDDIAHLGGLSLRKCKYRIRFYVFGSGGNWKTADWDLKEVWKWGGMVTFTPAALIEDPWAVKKVVEALEGKPFWETYIEPKTVGILSLNARKAQESELSWALDVLMTEITTSTETAFYNLALTAPPKWGLFEEYEWARVQVERTFIQDEDELRKSCEDEILEEYKELMKADAKMDEEIRKADAERKKKEAEAKKKEDSASAGNSGWGTGSGWGGNNGAADEIWGSGGGTTNNPWGESPWGSGSGGNDNPWDGASESNNDPWGMKNDSTPTTTSTAAKPAEIDLSKMGDENHISTMSNEVIQGLKWFQLQPCFMLETRRFVVIDSSKREGKLRSDKLEVELYTADKFVKHLEQERWW